eukprot:COSAG01_NODE_6918_length_3439_cov_26.474850_2_plen_114_part_00
MQRVKYCCVGEHAFERGIFHLPSQDPLAPPKYVSVRSQQIISLALITLLFIFNFVMLRIAIYTNDICEGAAQLFLALLLFSAVVSVIMMKIGYHLGYVIAAAEYLPQEFSVGV